MTELQLHEMLRAWARDFVGASIVLLGVVYAVPPLYRLWEGLIQKLASKPPASSPVPSAQRVAAVSEYRLRMREKLPSPAFTACGLAIVACGGAVLLGACNFGAGLTAAQALLALLICWTSARAAVPAGQRRVALLEPRSFPRMLPWSLAVVPIAQIPVIAIVAARTGWLSGAIALASFFASIGCAWYFGKYASRTFFGIDLAAERHVDDLSRALVTVIIVILAVGGAAAYVLASGFVDASVLGYVWVEFALVLALYVPLLQLLKRRRAQARSL